MIPGRPDDKFGGTFIYTRISDVARARDRDVILFTGVPQPIRDYELSMELTYLAQIRPGWTVQPDFQYVIHPSGNVLNPKDPTGTSTIKNAMLFGMRMTIQY